MATNTVKLELAKLLDDDKHRSILYLLDADWPAAIQIVPVAMRVAGEPERTPECLLILKESLRSYQQSLGQTDRQRLKAFLVPFIDGLCGLLSVEPLELGAVTELSAVLEEGVGKRNYSAVRERLIELLMPTSSSLGRVWRVINKV